jgi:vancomycin permeability regulator SanA
MVIGRALGKCVVVVTRRILSDYPHSADNYPKGAEASLLSHTKEVRSIEASTLGCVLAPRRHVSGRYLLVKLAWLLLGMGIIGLATVAAAVSFVRSTASGHIYTESNVPASPVALVLGAQVNPDGTPSAFLAARLDLTKRLFDAGIVEMIIVSGDHLAPEFDEPAAMRDYLIRAGLPTEKVIADPGGFDTYESCLRAKRIFNLSRLIIVTQSYHLVRAVATCRALGIEAAGVGDDSARKHTIAWWRGAIRDQLACVKTVVDLATRSEPMPDQPQTAVAASK